MAVNKVPVLKRCRSLGLEPSYLGYDKKSNRELKRANKKVSEYGLQLREKQKAKFIYGVLEKPFHNYYVKADQMKGMTGTNLMTMLESRFCLLYTSTLTAGSAVLMWIGERITEKGVGNGISIVLTINIISVSYTHLDVYKRQIGSRSMFCNTDQDSRERWIQCSAGCIC